MGRRSEFIEWLEEQLAPLGPLRLRGMFGAHGVYLDDLCVGIVDDDVLYLKTDDMSRPRFAAAGCEPFRYRRNGEEVELSFRAPPESALEEREALLGWVEIGRAAALRAKASKAKKGKR